MYVCNFVTLYIYRVCFDRRLRQLKIIHFFCILQSGMNNINSVHVLLGAKEVLWSMGWSFSREYFCGSVQVQKRNQGFSQRITVSQCVTGYWDHQSTGVIFYWGPLILTVKMESITNYVAILTCQSSLFSPSLSFIPFASHFSECLYHWLAFQP